MKKYLILFVVLLFSSSAFAAVELDADSNGGIDVDKGGTNAITAGSALTSLGAEAALGNPGTTGFVLSSTDAGVRSWISNAAMTYPGSGISISTGSAWGTSLTAPSGTIVGTTDAQTISNKSIITPLVAGNATGTLTAAQVENTLLSNCDGSTTCQAATASVVLTMPTIASGFKFIAAIGSALDPTYTWRITMPTGRYIYLNGVKGSATGSLIFTAPAVGDNATCVSFQSSATPTWDLICTTNSASVTGN